MLHRCTAYVVADRFGIAIGQFRKIRCNVEDSNPCSNCALEKIECTITKRRKTKYASIFSLAILT
jgi:hypothetical protein